MVGIGLDGRTLVSADAEIALAEAQILCGSPRHLAHFSEHSALQIPWEDLHQGITVLKHHLTQGYKRIVLLASGDPLFFGIGRLLLSHFAPEILRFYPQVSAVQLAFSRLKIPWQSAQIISIHGRSWENLIPPLKQGVATIAIFTDPMNNVAIIAQVIQELKLPISYQIWVCEWLGSPQEKVQLFSLDEALNYANNSLNIVVLMREPSQLSNPNSLPVLGLSDAVFNGFPDQPGLMTKKEIRSLILGELNLQDGQTIWDVGAGTGTVAIEMARLLPKSAVYAIEKKSIGVQLIHQNCQQLGVKNVNVIAGVAPEIFAELPNPDRVFIGGSGGNLTAILSTLSARLTPGGILVLALATQEHQAMILTWAKQQHWPYHALDVRLSRSLAVGDLTRWHPLNPITLMQLTKPAG
ncbi:precorrin-6Y C5,15-methyltransferase [Gloeomargarita lithophora Alchichica-D10]|uniref:Precorrin-6Y C5,15-methyltransferase n=1 Tax=Gloeomargarita lithophora Alchichica-D10 TaxID=1188229 RepID=A0A1J0AHA4_9CYAN|nr:precorrin-6Y C5,15-methyltransferase [Gloeomargarita lithophora Alchichica-D10]